jgi:dienelactone hydrolase
VPGWIRRRWIVLIVALPLIGVPCAGLSWLSFEAHRDHDNDLRERKGHLLEAQNSTLAAAPGLLAEFVHLTSDSGLSVSLRVVRPANRVGALPVLLLLGGHRTGSEAVSLFTEKRERAIVALDYPYDGPSRTKGIVATLRAAPAVRVAFFDTAPAIWLAVDWLAGQPWADSERLALAGVSLGVPFAATAAAKDARIHALMLVHGAADNRAWIAHNVQRRMDAGRFAMPLATVLNWFVYGPMHDTAQHVHAVAPRPVLIVAARDDERVPPGQARMLFAAARQPKNLRWTDGRHVQPGRRDVIEDLLRIADEELAAMSR